MEETRSKAPDADVDAGPALRLHVRELHRALAFQREVLGAEIVSSDDHSAVLRCAGARWTLVADAGSELSVLRELAGWVVRRGAGIEIGVDGLDPDQAEARARAGGHAVLSAARDAADGAREAHLVDSDGYVWVARRRA